MAEAIIARRGVVSLPPREDLLTTFTLEIQKTVSVTEGIILAKPIKKFRGFRVETNGRLNPASSNIQYGKWYTTLNLVGSEKSVSCEVASGTYEHDTYKTVSGDETGSIFMDAHGNYYFGNLVRTSDGFSLNSEKTQKISDDILESNNIRITASSANQGGQVTYKIYTIR